MAGDGARPQAPAGLRGIGAADYVPADDPDDEEEGEGENDPVEEDGDKDEALRRAIETSELEELGRWPDLATTLRVFAEDAANQARM